MSKNPLQWTSWQKIAFRFFFVFLTLQVITEDFTGNLFGNTLVIWRLGETIFVQPCHWLNNHFFHFKYIPQTWTTFSGSLHTIRDTVYLLITCLACVLWTVLDRQRSNYNKLHYWFSQCLVVVLSCILFAYGIVKVFPVQMPFPSFARLQTPVGNLSPFDLLWTTFGYGKPYQSFCGFFELGGAILVLFNRTRVAGLLISAAVMINVIILNYTYQVGVLILSFYILLIILFLLAPHVKQLLQFFFTRQPVMPFQYAYQPGKRIKAVVFKIITVLFIGTSFMLTLQSAYSRYTRAENINHSRQYSLVKNYVANGDTLKSIENDSLCWRTWSERVVDGKRYVSITTMNPNVYKTYTFDNDSSKHLLALHPFNQKDTASLNFNYTGINKTDWRLDGTVKEKQVTIELQRVNPDTMMNLLKTRRTIIIFDDESDQE
jgi:hypothetical protein